MSTGFPAQVWSKFTQAVRSTGPALETLDGKKDELVAWIDSTLAAPEALAERLKSLQADTGADTQAAVAVAEKLADISKDLQDAAKWDAIKRTLDLPAATVALARSFQPGARGFHARFDAVTGGLTGVTTAASGAVTLVAVAAPVLFPAAAVAISSAGMALFGIGVALQVARIVQNRHHAAGLAQFNDGGSSELGPGPTIADGVRAVLRGGRAGGASGNSVAALKAALEQLAADLNKRADELVDFHKNTLRKYQAELQSKLGGSTRPEAREAMQRLRDADDRGTRGAAALKAAASAAIRLARAL